MMKLASIAAFMASLYYSICAISNPAFLTASISFIFVLMLSAFSEGLLSEIVYHKALNKELRSKLILLKRDLQA